MFKQDGDKWRRVVASPQPKRIFEMRPIKWLLEHGTIVICRRRRRHSDDVRDGQRSPARRRRGVIDKDLASELLARELDADLFVMLTDADAVYVDWGKPTQKAIRRASPAALGDLRRSPPGRWDRRFRRRAALPSATGKSAAIGALADLSRIIAGEAGTTVVPRGQTVFA